MQFSVKKRVIVVVGVALIGVGTFVIYKKIMQRAAQAALSEDMAIFFDYAKTEMIPDLQEKLHKAEQEASSEDRIAKIKNDIQEAQVVKLIIEGDLQALKALPRESLEFKNAEIRVAGNRFKDEMNDTLHSRIIGGQNALTFALFRSVMDKSVEDEEKTLALLNYFFEKKLDPYALTAFVYWVKDTQGSSKAHDYVATFSLKEIAKMYSSNKIQRLLDEYAREMTAKESGLTQ